MAKRCGRKPGRLLDGNIEAREPGVILNSKGIILKGNDEFKEKTFEYLKTIASTPAGHKMLKQISDSGKTTTIIPSRYTNSTVNVTGREDGLDSNNFKQGVKLPQSNYENLTAKRPL